jgi:tetratricopeptide (TPR) repeat protein
MRALVLVALLLGTGPIAEREAKIAKIGAELAAKPGDPKLLLRLATQYVHLADETERSENFEAARRHLTEAERGGAGVEVRAWRGVLRCVEAKYGSGPTARTMAQQGLAQLDATLDEEPSNLMLRLMRASVALRVPREWKRVPQAKEDLLTVDLAIRRDPARIARYELDAAEVYFKLGQALYASGELADARASWKRAAQAAPDSRYARVALRWLKKLR